MYIVMYSFYLALFVVLIVTSMSTIDFHLFIASETVRDNMLLLNFVQVSWLTVVSEGFVPKQKLTTIIN